MSYTKGKWELHNTAKDSIVGEDNISLAFTDAWNRAPEENEANAKRIVHCLNNYDGLVEALKEIAKDGCPADIEIAKQTLAKTEEE